MTKLVRSRSPVADAYDRWARTYDTEPNRTRSLAAEVLRTSGPALQGKRVLELGCGTGQNTAWIAERAAAVLGLDVSEGMLARARENAGAPHVDFRLHDIRAPWPVDTASTAVVIAMLVLEHIEQLAPIFGEAARVLERGGELFLCELHPIRQILGSQARFSSEGGEGVELVTAFGHDIADYVNAAIGAGFALERLGEWRDAGAGFEVPPRIVSARFARRSSAARLAERS